VKASVPPGTEELNLRAFDAGWASFETDYGTRAAQLEGALDRGT